MMEGTNFNSNSNSNSNPLNSNSGGGGGGMGGGGGGGVISPPFQSLPSKVKAGGGGGKEGNGRGKRRLPNPRELVAHYESQGMDKEAASLRVIHDLQNVLYNVVSSSSSSTTNKGGVEGGRGRGGSDSSSNIVNSRLAMLEMKLDSKPGYPQTLAIGVASAAISSALSNIWDFVRRFSSSNPN